MHFLMWNRIISSNNWATLTLSTTGLPALVRPGTREQRAAQLSMLSGSAFFPLNFPLGAAPAMTTTLTPLSPTMLAAWGPSVRPAGVPAGEFSPQNLEKPPGG